jgi:hypothetical protein
MKWKVLLLGIVIGFVLAMWIFYQPCEKQQITAEVEWAKHSSNRGEIPTVIFKLKGYEQIFRDHSGYWRDDERIAQIKKGTIVQLNICPEELQTLRKIPISVYGTSTI